MKQRKPTHKAKIGHNIMDQHSNWLSNEGIKVQYYIAEEKNTI